MYEVGVASNGGPDHTTHTSDLANQSDTWLQQLIASGTQIPLPLAGPRTFQQTPTSITFHNPNLLHRNRMKWQMFKIYRNTQYTPTLFLRMISPVLLTVFCAFSTFSLSMKMVPQSQQANPNGHRQKTSFLEITVHRSITGHNSARTVNADVAE